MTLLTTIALFFIGFAILIVGAGVLVSGARSIAHLLGLPLWFTGLVIVGIGTSVPELAINVAAALGGSHIGLETVIGSNTFNFLVILGVSALVSPLILRRPWVRRDIPLTLAAIGATAAVVLFPLAGDPAFLGVSRPEALGLLACFCVWMAYLFIYGGREDDGVEYHVYSGLVSTLFITTGILGVFFGGQWVVSGAEALALALGVSPALVALTVVSAGTSLPELAVSVMAFMRGQRTIAVGNIIGSNIFSFLGVIGIAGVIAPIPIAEHVRFDIAATFAAALLFFLLVRRRKEGGGYRLARASGVVMLAAYVVYLALVFLRG